MIRKLLEKALSTKPREFHVDALRAALVRQDADLVEGLWNNAEALAELIDGAKAMIENDGSERVYDAAALIMARSRTSAALAKLPQ